VRFGHQQERISSALRRSSPRARRAIESRIASRSASRVNSGFIFLSLPSWLRLAWSRLPSTISATKCPAIGSTAISWSNPGPQNCKIDDRIETGRFQVIEPGYRMDQDPAEVLLGNRTICRLNRGTPQSPQISRQTLPS
jgi:hypothetical protein